MKHKKVLTVIALLILVFLIKSFFFEAYRIPTASMEQTLLPGDFLVVNKAAYKLGTPSFIPLTNIPIEHIDFWNYSDPKRNDIIVFDYPGNIDEFRPEQQVFYIKRTIGLPGDTVNLVKQKVYVNNTLLPDPPKAEFNEKSIKVGQRDFRIFPPDKNWNSDNYGPIKVPKKGDTIQLNSKNVGYWGNIINREYGRKVVSTEGSVITIERKPVREYTFKKNYYFVLGDNRAESMDSRYWGFVPEDLIIGKALLIYWSIDPLTSSLNEAFKAIRWSRILSKIN